MRAASPSAVPTCAEVFMKPEARPRFPSSTAEVPRAVEATEAQPRPNPERAAPASTYGTPLSAVMPVVTSADVATTASPKDIVVLPPLRPAIRPPSTEPAITQRLNGKPARPAKDAE